MRRSFWRRPTILRTLVAHSDSTGAYKLRVPPGTSTRWRHGLTAGSMRLAKGQAQGTPSKKIDELIAYGDRSRFVTSIRVPVSERHSPDEFGLTFHVLAPLQDSFGIITPNSLFYTATHRGAFVPDIDPREHRLMIHGMVDRPLVFTMEELKRLPYVSRIHFIECLGNRARPTHKTVQETHG